MIEVNLTKPELDAMAEAEEEYTARTDAASDPWVSIRHALADFDTAKHERQEALRQEAKARGEVDTLQEFGVDKLPPQTDSGVIDSTQPDNTQVGGNHYLSMNVQPWEAMAAWMTPEQYRGFLHGNTIKYLARASFKGAYREDLLKAKHYLTKLLSLEG